MPNLNICANQNESHLSSVYFIPEYRCICDGLARCTLYLLSINPSTSQYQLYVDSTTTPFIILLNGFNVFSIIPKSFGSFLLRILQSFLSITPIKLLSECKSIPT